MRDVCEDFVDSFIGMVFWDWIRVRWLHLHGWEFCFFVFELIGIITGFGMEDP